MYGLSVPCWGSGTPLREFIHLDELGEVCVRAEALVARGGKAAASEGGHGIASEDP